MKALNKSLKKCINQYDLCKIETILAMNIPRHQITIMNIDYILI